MPVVRRSILLACLISALSGAPLVRAADEAPAATASHSAIYATVNGKAITTQDYESTFTNHVRQKFYHREIPAGQLDEARREVHDKLVNRILILDEAKRRNVPPDMVQIETTIAGYEQQYASSPVWKENRERLLPGLRQQLVDQSMAQRLEQQVRQVPEPTEAEAKAYYDAHPDLFTEPEKMRVSAIMLAVDPSATPAVRQAARDEAKAIYRRLEAGADFGDTARLHSNSRYGENGGDMGYLHRGMMPESLQQKIDSYELGKINEPMDILEGVAIFRLDERLPPKKRDFADVAQRARELLQRERQEAAWKSLLAELTAKAEIKVHHQIGMEKRESGRQ